MLSRFRRTVRSFLLLGFVLIPGVAAAQSSTATRGERPSAGIANIVDETDGYKVEFGDDPLDADLGDGIVPRIVVRGVVPARTLLIRVRTQFVTTMLRSVEGI